MLVSLPLHEIHGIPSDVLRPVFQSIVKYMKSKRSIMASNVKFIGSNVGGIVKSLGSMIAGNGKSMDSIVGRNVKSIQHAEVIFFKEN